MKSIQPTGLQAYYVIKCLAADDHVIDISAPAMGAELEKATTSVLARTTWFAYSTRAGL